MFAILSFCDIITIYFSNFQNKTYSEEIIMDLLSLAQDLNGNSYPGRGIVIGTSADGKKAVTAYFIMGRSVNSRNRVFVAEGENMRKMNMFL